MQTSLALGFDFVEDVLVADLDGESAERFAAACGAKVRDAAVDVTDGGVLRRLLENADAVLNTVGPFCLFGAPIRRGR